MIGSKSNKMIVVQQHRCMVCMQEAQSIIAVERLPDDGLLWKAKHENGTHHVWTEHPSFFIQKKKRLPTKIKCPKCGKIGRVNAFTHSNNSYKINYYVAHEQRPGTWGKKGTMKRMRRCYISDPEQREIILKKLGRFISS